MTSSWHSQMTPHTSPSRTNYGVYFASSSKKNDRDISRAHCMTSQICWNVVEMGHHATQPSFIIIMSIPINLILTLITCRSPSLFTLHTIGNIKFPLTKIQSHWLSLLPNWTLLRAWEPLVKEIFRLFHNETGPCDMNHLWFIFKHISMVDILAF